LVARIEADGSVDVRGKKYQSLSLAVARPEHQSSAARRWGLPQTNGWMFWNYTDADGRTKLIDAHESPSSTRANFAVCRLAAEATCRVIGRVVAD
jgi:hypothetical protein